MAFFPVAFLGATLEPAFLPLAGCLAGAFFTGFALLDAARVVLEAAALETVALFAFGFDVSTGGGRCRHCGHFSTTFFSSSRPNFQTFRFEASGQR